MPAFQSQGGAVLALLAFLGTTFLAGAGLLLAGFLAWRGRRRAARRLCVGAGGGIVLYAATLLLFSALSDERVLHPGEEKHFCELDCHLAYSVRGVRRTETIGGPDRRIRAGGVYHVVTLRTRFDPETVSPRRPPCLKLRPNPRRIRVTDRRGRVFEPSHDGGEALAAAGEESVPLSRPLRPGESYLTRLVFDLPVDVESPRLVVTEEPWPGRLLIGHENSLGHRKTVFALQSTRTSALPVPVRPVALSRTLITSL